jgi:hypothetical protein
MNQEGKQVVISFKFAVYELEIKHKIVQELGAFSLFCMKAISQGVLLEELVSIMQLEQHIIEKQLSFAISRKYLDNDYSLTDKGLETILLYEFLDACNTKKLHLALEHYIENSTKHIFCVENEKFTTTSQGVVVEDNIYDYKIQKKFDELLEEDREKLFHFLVGYFPEYEEVIRKFLEDFIIKLQSCNETLYYNFKQENHLFFQMLSGYETKDSLRVNIPLLEVKKSFSSQILEQEKLKDLEERFCRYSLFNLVDGSSYSYKKEKFPRANITLHVSISKEEILVKLQAKEQEKLGIDELLFVDMKTEFQECFGKGYFDIKTILEAL